MTTKLTPRQASFVAEYLKDLNATQAARRAGYSERTVNRQGPRLLVNVGVAAAIQEAFEERSRRTEITQDRVLLELARLAFADIGEIVSWDKVSVSIRASEELSEDAIRSIREIVESGDGHGRRVQIKLHDKKGPLELLMRHLGMLRGEQRSPLDFGPEGNVKLFELRVVYDNPVESVGDLPGELEAGV